MKNKLLLAGLLFVAGCGKPAGPPETITLSIVGTNDFHGALLNNYSDIAVFGGYVNNLRAARQADGGEVLLVDAGDMWTGTLESHLDEGQKVVEAFNLLGYSVTAIGNHDFDFGPVGPRSVPESPGDDPRGTLKLRAAEANFPFLAANLLDETTGRPVEWENVFPSTIVDAGAIRVGIVGVTTEQALIATIAPNVVGLEVAALAPVIEQEATKLRADGADIIVVAAHAGGRCAAFDDPSDLSTCDPDSEIFQVARSLPTGLVDVIVGGHVDDGISHFVNGIAIINSHSRGNYFGRVDLYIDPTGDTLPDRRIFPPQPICEYVAAESGECAPQATAAARASYEGAEVVRDPALDALLSEVLAATAAMKAEKLGPVLVGQFNRAGHVESAIGNLMTDILLDAVEGADVAMHNTIGGIRAGLPTGELTFGDVYEMFPFDNRLTLIRLRVCGVFRAVVAPVTGSLLPGPRRRNPDQGRVHRLRFQHRGYSRQR